MADKPADSKPNQVFDVSHPGKTAPSATSKPIIVGRGPMMKDRTLTADPPQDDDAEEKPKTEVTKVPSGNGKTIQPISVSSTDKDETEEVSTSKPDVKPPQPVPEAEKAAPTEDAQGDTGNEPGNAIVDAVLNQSTKKKHDDTDAVPNAQQDEKIQQLIDDKTYFVKIGHAQKHHSLLVTLLVLLVAVSIAAGALYYAHLQGSISLPI